MRLHVRRPARIQRRPPQPRADRPELPGAAAQPLHELPGEPDAMAEALAVWTLARLEELRPLLPDLAAG